MGLDMYLTADKYIGFREDRDKLELSLRLDGIKLPPACKIEKITVEVAYWRKANHIHKWFVDHVQDGSDNRQASPVALEQLRELLAAVTKVLKNRKLAPELLPCKEGFFFGSTEYNDNYFAYCEYTKKTLERTLPYFERERDNGVYWELKYDSSW